MLVKIVREDGTDKSTPGVMYVNNKFFSYTLEDVERPEIMNDPSKKVYGKTAIPRGRYRAIVNKSDKFKREMVLLLDVPHFEGIRVHSGNDAEDTHGCPLVARNRKNKDYVWGDSRKLEGMLTSLVKKAIANGEKVWFEVTHKEEGNTLVLPEVHIKA